MRLLLTTISGLALVLSVACGGSESAKEAESSQPKMTAAEMQEPATLTIGITGMMCPDGCAAAIQKEVYALEGISTSSVDFGSKTGTFEYDASVISQDEIVAAIEKVNKGAYKVELEAEGEDPAVPASDTEAIEEITSEDEASV